MTFTRGDNQYSIGRPIKWITLCWEVPLCKVHGVTGCGNRLFSGYSSGRLTCWIMVVPCCMPLRPLVKATATSSSQSITERRPDLKTGTAFPQAASEVWGERVNLGSLLPELCICDNCPHPQLTPGSSFFGLPMWRSMPVTLQGPPGLSSQKEQLRDQVL